jgi:hypothetical protein
LLALALASTLLAQSAPDCIGLKIREINLAQEVQALKANGAVPRVIRAAQADYLQAHRDFVSQCLRRPR